jgi:hypothetical protein
MNKTDRRPGRWSEIVVSRHPDEIASEANSTIAEALQFEHVAVGFWRKFAHPAWAKRLAPDIDVLPPVAGRSLDPKPLLWNDPFDLGKEQPDDDGGGGPEDRARVALSERVIDGWRGISALRFEGLPHFYKAHVTVHAAAGVVVSEPVGAVVPEGQYVLRLPWSEDATAQSHARAVWWIERDDAAATVSLCLDLPLIRNIDGMPLDDAVHWHEKGGAAVAPVLAMPDPGVVYEVSTRRMPEGVDAAKGGLLLASDVLPQIDFRALPDSQNGDAAYACRHTGGLTSGCLPESLTPMAPAAPPQPFRLKPKLQLGWNDALPAMPANQLPPALHENLDLATATGTAGRAFEFSYPWIIKGSLGGAPAEAKAALADLIHYVQTHEWHGAGRKGWGSVHLGETLNRIADAQLPLTQELLLPSWMTRPGTDFMNGVKRLQATGADFALNEGHALAPLLILRVPPDDDDFVALTTAAEAAAMPSDQRSALQEQLHGLATAQIIGPGRQLALKAFKGLVDPVQDIIARKLPEEGP